VPTFGSLGGLTEPVFGNGDLGALVSCFAVPAFLMATVVSAVILRIACLLAHFAGRSFGIELYEFGSDSDEELEIHSILETLHLVCQSVISEPEESDPDGAEQSGDST
jgi:hypothetical protein